jgi:hypothetical protein
MHKSNSVGWLKVIFLAEPAFFLITKNNNNEVLIILLGLKIKLVPSYLLGELYVTKISILASQRNLKPSGIFPQVAGL